MRIRMLTTTRGAADGHTVREYVAGTEHDLGGTVRADELAAVFLREGWAVGVKPSFPPPVSATDPRPPPPQRIEVTFAGGALPNSPPPPPGSAVDPPRKKNKGR